MSERVRVLLVEDDPADAQRLGQMLNGAQSTAFDLEHAADLQSGVEKLRLQPFDVLLLDLGLPGRDDLETVSDAMAAAPDVPIIALGPVDDRSATLKTVRVGVPEYFVKSRIEPEALIQAILRQAARKRRFFGGPARDGTSTPPGPEPGAPRRTIRVLIVEDNPADFVLIRRMLASVETVSFEVTHASTLSSALKELRPGVEVVLLDLNLPDSRDLDTLRRVRAQDPSVPTIVLTGIDDRQKAVEALSNGANDYFVKERLDAQLLERAILRCVKPAEVPE